MIRLKVSEWLGRKKWTQKELIKRTGIRPSTVGAMYHETIRRLDLEHIDKLCEAFECQPGDLMEYIPNKK